MNQTELFYSRNMAEARRIMGETLERDSGWYLSYYANISCRIHDMLHDMGRSITMKQTDKIARSLMELIWEIKNEPTID